MCSYNVTLLRVLKEPGLLVKFYNRIVVMKKFLFKTEDFFPSLTKIGYYKGG